MQGFETNITSVEISLTDKCNRSCSFCPQTFDSFQNLNLNKFIEYDTLVNIKNQLDQFIHKPLISLAGFGEPLLYKKIVNAVQLFYDYKIVIFTNLAFFLISDNFLAPIYPIEDLSPPFS